MLLGGLLRADGVPSADVMSDPMLKDLRTKLAFVSCSGFTTETGLTESDILDMQLKARMVEVAGSVIALIDGSKFGKLGLAPFARVDQVSAHFQRQLDYARVDRAGAPRRCAADGLRRVDRVRVRALRSG